MRKVEVANASSQVVADGFLIGRQLRGALLIRVVWGKQEAMMIAQRIQSLADSEIRLCWSSRIIRRLKGFSPQHYPIDRLSMKSVPLHVVQSHGEVSPSL